VVLLHQGVRQRRCGVSVMTSGGRRPRFGALLAGVLVVAAVSLGCADRAPNSYVGRWDSPGGRMPLFIESDGTGAWESAELSWRSVDDGIRIQFAEQQHLFRGRTPICNGVLDGADILVLDCDVFGETRFTRVPSEQVYSRGFLSGTGDPPKAGTMRFDEDGTYYFDGDYRGRYSLTELGYIRVVAEGFHNEVPVGYAQVTDGGIEVRLFAKTVTTESQDFLLR